MTEFYRTKMGMKFYNLDVPKIADALDKIAEILKASFHKESVNNKESALTSEQKAARDYVERGSHDCPYPDCDSEFVTGGSVDIDCENASQKCICDKCGRSFIDIYRLVDVEFNDSLKMEDYKAR